MLPLRVFVSSTSTDLQEHRQAVRDAIMSLDHHPDDMTYWSADERSGTTHSLDRVRQCDVLILLIAHRYGYVAEGADFSVTELEYRAARTAKIPVLAFFLDPSVPWLPEHIESAKERLDAFKDLVEAEVTRKLFRTPDELALQVVQALAQLTSNRSADLGSGRRRFAGRVRTVSLPVNLASEPDLLVQIGTAEDGLPLLLDIRRRRDLSNVFAELTTAVGRRVPQALDPQALLEMLSQSLFELGTKAWTAERLTPVLRDDGETETLYVSSFNLSRSFTSILASIIDGPARGQAKRPPNTGSVAFIGRASMPQTAQPLQSTGGSNRFLGISPSSGATYSVGWDDKAGTMREWRPFICENALGAFPNSTFSFAYNHPENITGPLAEASDLLFKGLHNRVTDEFTQFPGTLKVVVTWQAVIEIVSAIARELTTRHTIGRVHGDIKPHNVLLTEDGIVLIDSFDVELDGELSPGWTPDWSAPEQVLGRLLSPTTDIYPLAVMLGRILGGELVGEVRKYRGPTTASGRREFDIFHDPSLFLDTRNARISGDGVRAWRRLIEHGLRFDPERRPDPQQFAAEIDDLATKYPIDGTCTFVPPGELMAARLIDGAEVIARAVVDQADHSDLEHIRARGTAMSICPKGHNSIADDYCDECGAPIGRRFKLGDPDTFPTYR